jgi:hypothetical protein
MPAVMCYLAAVRQGASPSISSRERMAPTLCAYGLIAELVTAGVGYAVCNMVWPNFYFEPVQAGKNTWLAVQGLSILVFFVGACYAVRRCPQSGAATAMKHALVRWFRERGWRPIAWVCGIAAGAFWVYSGAPMICH